MDGVEDSPVNSTSQPLSSAARTAQAEMRPADQARVVPDREHGPLFPRTFGEPQAERLDDGGNRLVGEVYLLSGNALQRDAAHVRSAFKSFIIRQHFRLPFFFSHYTA